MSASGPVNPPGDPFPRASFGALVGRLPRYLRLAWGLAGESRLSRMRRAGVLAAAAYLASPVDLVPGIIPVVGQLDDIAVALLALRAALRALDPATRERHLAAAGLAPGDIDQDLGALAAVAAWLARRGIAVGRRLATLVLAASLTAGRVGARAFRRGAPVVARLGGRLAREAGGALTRVGGRGRGAAAR
ncbi:MAG TPA: YkvA family protein [Patescibacteria group bacterium]|nr:YkvA family protein [Patescibacteria group bacterium]